MRLDGNVMSQDPDLAAHPSGYASVGSRYYPMFVAVFTALVIISNVTATKGVAFGPAIAPDPQRIPPDASRAGADRLKGWGPANPLAHIERRHQLMHVATLGIRFDAHLHRRCARP